MNNERLHTLELIERYLAGDLRGADLSAFEANMQQNPELQREIALHRCLNRMLEDTPKLELRAKLQQLRARHDNSMLEATPDSSLLRFVFGRWKWHALAAALTVLIVSLVLFRNKFTDPVFAKNAALEARLGDSDPADGIKFTLDPAADNARYRLSAGGAIQLDISGDLQTAVLPEPDAFVVRIYNNLQEPVSTGPGSPSLPIAFSGPAADDPGGLAFGQAKRYPFLIRQKLALPKGLYYYVIAFRDEPDGVFVGKFRVDH